ncbi:MAG TPA: DNA repair protein RecO [Gemmatimonadota bacterium]|nr:DNA repair protein RecO [Gemmatimonadota bacterium]
MPIVTTRAVVLQTYAYSDTSKILRLVTREHGPRSAIAKGARRPGSRFGGVIEPFAEGMVTLYLKEGRDLHTLSDFDLIRERQGLGRDLVRFSGASVLCEVVMRLAPEHRDDRLFAALVRGLDELLAAPPDDVEGTALRAIWRLVAVLGFAPDLRRCSGCGRDLEGQTVRFDYASGGLRCGTCGGEGPRLTPGDVRVLQGLLSPGPVPRGPGLQQRRLLADFIRYHMAEGTHLRSLAFLERGEDLR